MSELDPAEQRRAVRERYGAIAEGGGDCCDDGCGTDRKRAERLGYDASDLDVVPEANLGLGCGNPTAIASLEEGETVLDLGSGGGFDCFLAAREVGDAGRVIGVDMTPEMVERARENAANDDATNVEFRLGEIEHLPVADGTIDVILSNCVINLSADEERVFEEAFRVLRPGGRLAISDVVLTADVPETLRNDPERLTGCVSGAATIGELETMLGSAGFEAIRIEPEEGSETVIREWSDEYDLSDVLVSARIEGRKPAAEAR
ncbi:arsenite methyltransferase [Halalkalicoccus ordinarius]|uniref:arsenite methyltransferase n=1 Tax=Halalkalicoccus ordinarius TaxID=3116651 RepID=UPI00300F320D